MYFYSAIFYKGDHKVGFIQEDSTGHVISAGNAPGTLHIPQLAWEGKKIKLLQIEIIDEVSCVWMTCEMNIKGTYKGRKLSTTLESQSEYECDKCIAPPCNATHGIKHTNQLIMPLQACKFVSCYHN